MADEIISKDCFKDMTIEGQLYEILVAIDQIGAPYIHSHNELYSLDSSKNLELQNNGDLVLTDGATSITMTPVKSGQIVVGSAADATPVNSVRCMTQGEYDALGTYDPNTLYFIK